MSYNTVVVNLIISLNRNLDKPISEKIGLAGGNTGNIIFTEAVKEQVRFEEEIWINPTALHAIHNPSVIIPAANFIISGNQDSLAEALIRFMNGTNCPITLAGLGAQSTSQLNTPSKLMKHVSNAKKQCFKMLSERTVTLGIRGEFTAECLELLGIHNYRIIGCPSLYKYMNGTFPKLPKPSLDNVQISVTPPDLTDNKILEMGYSLQADWLMQMSTDLVEYKDNLDELDKYKISQYFPKLLISEDKLKSYIRKHGKTFWTVEEWEKYYRYNHISFAFGSRFHGNMAALRNNVPALWITHDSRTTELVHTLNLPFITRDNFVEDIVMPERLLEYCDYSKFYDQYPKLLLNYKKFLTENHIELL